MIHLFLDLLLHLPHLSYQVCQADQAFHLAQVVLMVLELSHLQPLLLEVQVVLLLRAGAMAFGCWRGDELLQHKAVRKYVVRGNGKSQVTHLKTRGKSRYGSRLRLQNWRSLLGETNERLASCEEQFGPFERVFYGVPVRVWSQLFQGAPSPPFPIDDARLQRLRMHVHRPDHQELLRVRRQMCSGRISLSV